MRAALRWRRPGTIQGGCRIISGTGRSTRRCATANWIAASLMAFGDEKAVRGLAGRGDISCSIEENDRPAQRGEQASIEPAAPTVSPNARKRLSAAPQAREL